MDLSSWESLGAGSASFISKVSEMTKSLTGESNEKTTKIVAIPFKSEESEENEEIWILGRKYQTKKDFVILKKEIKSRFWFSYRKDFPQIGDSGMTSDKGWGCMLRDYS